MKKKYLGVLIVVLCVMLASTSVLAGGCPEGKTEVGINLPNGTQKMICVSDNALQGLETAADHSDGTIVPSSCPCWNEADISYYSANKMLVNWYVSTDISRCSDINGNVLLEANKIGFFCVNNVTKIQWPITAEQWNACDLLLPYRY